MSIPFLIDFKSYTFSGDLCQSIDDMVSIGLQQKFSFSEVNYNLGSGDNITLPIAIKNITNNANLFVELSVDENVFVVNDNESLSSILLTLTPGQTSEIKISLNKRRLNETVGIIDSNIKLVIKNITNGTIVTRAVGVSKLDPRYITDRLL